MILATWIFAFLVFFVNTSLLKKTCSDDDYSILDKLHNLLTPLMACTGFFLSGIIVANRNHLSYYMSMLIILTMSSFVLCYIYNSFFSGYVGEYVCPHDVKSSAIGATIYTICILIPMILFAAFNVIQIKKGNLSPT